MFLYIRTELSTATATAAMAPSFADMLNATTPEQTPATSTWLISRFDRHNFSWTYGCRGEDGWEARFGEGVQWRYRGCTGDAQGMHRGEHGCDACMSRTSQVRVNSTYISHVLERL